MTVMEQKNAVEEGLMIEGAGRLAQTAALMRACMEQPESTSRALEVLLQAEPENNIARGAIGIAESVTRIHAAQADTGADIAGTLATAASNLAAGSQLTQAAEVLALAVRLGAAGETVDRLIADISGKITQSMRDAMTAGDEAAAARDADILKALAPGSSEAWLISGRLKLKQGMAEEARSDLEQATDLSPQSQNTLLNFARAQSGSGQYRAAVLTLFKLLRLADGTDGRYRPLATAELEAAFISVCQAAAQAQSKGDSEQLQQSLGLLEEIADGVSGSMIEYVAGARNCVRAAIGYARAAQAAGRGRLGLSACDSAMEIEPDVAALWSTIARLRLHYNENAQAAQAFRQSLDLDGDQASMRDGLAEALFRDGKFEAALAEAERAAAAAVGNTAISDRRNRISRALDFSGSAPVMPTARRHVAILGMPNQGNARLGCRIAQAAGGAFVGESFWLAGQGGKNGEEVRYSSCQRCRRPDCDIYGMEFRTALSADSGVWYQKAAEASGRGLLVSSDNSAQIVRRLDPAMACDAVIAFRAPASAWAMMKEHYGRQRRELPQLMHFLQTWHRTFSAALYEFPQLGTRIAVNLDDAAGDGSDQVSSVLSVLGLAAASDVADEQHFFGVNADEVLGDFPVMSDLVDALPAAEVSQIVAFRDAGELYQQLQAV